MSYMALYRKWRPATFDEVKGQDTIVQTLRNQILYDRIGHAYCFCGTRGTGKTSVAKLFARAVNCSNPQNGNPCNECASCRSILSQSSMDVFEIDAASNNGVEHIRELREQIQYSPVEGRFKVYIIDEVHMLSISAFNALLKTLEEPPSYVIFILATTEKHKVPVTILSRCQKYDFRRISIETIAGHLSDLMEKESIEAEPKALQYIARAADGSMRDALSLLDQCISFYLGQPLTYEHVLSVLGAADTTVFSTLLRQILSGSSGEMLLTVEDIIMEGRDISTFLGDFLWYLRNLLVLKDQQGSEDSLEMSADSIRTLKEEAQMVDSATLLRYIRVLSELSEQIRFSSQKRVLVEVGFIRLCQPEMETDTESLLSRIALLEKKVENAPVVIQAAPSQDMPKHNPASEPVEPAAERTPQTPEEADQLLSERFSSSQKEALTEIAGNWHEVTGHASALMRQYLKHFSVSIAKEANKLLLLPKEDSETVRMARAYFTQNHHEKLDELSGIVQEATGRTVLFECPDLDSAHTDTVPIELDLIRRIKDVIDFPITVE